MACAEAYLHTKCHLNPSNRFATIHQRHRQDRQRSDRANRFWYAIGPLCVCPVLSVTLVYCGQTVRWIKMSLGMEVGLGAGHTVLDEDPATPQKRAQAPPPALVGPCLLWPNGWMEQGATWYGGRSRSRRHCVRWGSAGPSPPQKGGHSTPTFRHMSLVAKQLDGSRCHLIRR